MTAKPRPIQAPHDLCSELDAKGESYWLERRSLTGPQASEMWDVIHHGPEWVQIGNTHANAHYVQAWVRWADLGPFEIVEG